MSLHDCKNELNNLELLVSVENESESSSNINPGGNVLYHNGKTVSNGTEADLGVILLPNCHYVTKLNWITITSSKAKFKQYAWIIYEENFLGKSTIAVIEIDASEKLIKHFSILYLCSLDHLALDADCNGIANIDLNMLGMIATIHHLEEGKSQISFYNLPFLACKNKDETIPILKLTEIKMHILEGNFQRIAWNPHEVKQIALADSNCNIFILNAETGTFIRIYHNAHSMEITDLCWINIPAEKKDYVGSCSHDGFVKVWDSEDTFSPCISHSTGQVL